MMLIENARPRLVCLTLFFAVTSHAQWFGVDTARTIYRLDADASYQTGCFDPCLCPLSEPLPLRGTFVLGRPSIGDVVDFREVSQVNWTVGRVGDTLHKIAGGGTYRVTNFGQPQRHALDLELSIDGGESQTFFSDLSVVDTTNGRIDITVSMNGLFCHDTAIRVSASPVPRFEVDKYRVVEGSNFVQGCFDPCDCLLEERRPLRGSFKLIKLFDAGTWAEFSMLDVRLHFGGDGVTDRTLGYVGFGHYTLVQGFAGPAHAMDLSLRLPGGELEHFDAELENTDTLFPNIDIVVDMNEQVCFDKVITLVARTPRYAQPRD